MHRTSSRAAGPCTRSGRVKRSAMSTGAVLLGILIASLGVSAASANEGSVKGALAYTEEMSWDYDQDRKVDRVQFWLDFDVTKKDGKVQGNLIRYLKDLDTGRKIYRWAHMHMTGDNTRPPQLITDLVIDGKTATFSTAEVKYTVTDSSALKEGETPTFEADNGVLKQNFEIFDGMTQVNVP